MRPKRVRDPYAPPRAKSPEQALSSLMALCARAEKSSGDARRLMSRWGVEAGEQQRILVQLERERFIDDERYAAAYIREKISINGWGRRKIESQLRLKGVSREIIEAQISQTDGEKMSDRLRELLEKRSRTVKYKTKYELRDKLFRYGASLGYELSVVNEMVREILTTIDSKSEEEEECFDF